MRAFLLWAAALAVLPACGGNVILDTGAGGRGGAGGSSTSGIGGFGGSTLAAPGPGPGSEVVVTVSSTSVSSTFSSSDFASSSTGGDGCTTGADCTQCPDQQACFKCGEANHQAGVADYNALATCVVCQACFSTCDAQMMMPDNCPGPPPMSKCDVSQPFDACTSCQQCAVMPGSLCAAQYDTCMANPDCVALTNVIASCH